LRNVLYKFSTYLLTRVGYRTHNCCTFCFWRRRSVLFLFVSREMLNGVAPNSHGRRVWSLAGTSLKVKVTGTKNGIFVTFGGLRAVYVW